MRFWAIFKRDIKKFIRNPIAMIVTLVFPIGYLLIVGNSIQGSLKHLPLVVVDLDRGPKGQRIMELLLAIEASPKIWKVYRENNPQAAIEATRRGFYAGALIIPADFSRKVVRGQRADLGLFLDNINIFSADSLYNGIRGALSGFPQEYIPIRQELAQVEVQEENLYPVIDYDQFIIPGIIIMGVFLGSITTGVFGLIMDRFLGIHEAYFVTPLEKRDIVGGLIFSGLFITTIISLIILLLSSFITGLSLKGGMVGFLAITAVIALATLGHLGLMFIILGRAGHPRIIGAFASFLNVILFFPSGAIYPIHSFPRWLRAFSVIDPETYAVSALKSLIFRGPDLWAIKSDLLILTLFTTLALFIATFIFKRTL
jgi:ABC-2 type transport system permease protein